MYIPASFRMDDPAKIFSLMEAYSFATLVTCDSAGPFATHLPIRHIRDGEQRITLVSHMARANPQWCHFASDTEVLAIFAGPHAYVSPSWYTTEPAVPTWNYAAVHVYGRPTILEDHDRIVSLLMGTIEFYERSFRRPWPGILPTEYFDKMIEAIVAFEILVTRIEGKFKLGQNRSPEDIAGVYRNLIECGDSNALKLAELLASETTPRS
jgi:transcriptional regulator